MRLQYIIWIVYNIFRILFIKLIYGQSIYIHGLQLISPTVQLKCIGKSKLIIEGRLHASTNCSIISTKGGNLIIRDRVYMNRNVNIVCRKNIIIGEGTTIGPNVCFFDHDHDIYNQGRVICGDIVIGKNVWIGANTVITKGVYIGDNSVIAAGSVITKDIPKNCIIIQKRMEYRKNINII